MSIIARSWLSFAAIGTGIIHAALVVGSPLSIGLPMIGLGVAELTWGVLILAANRILLPRPAQCVALAPLLVWGVLALGAAAFSAPEITSALRFVPLTIAGVFGLSVAAALGVELHRRREAERPVTPTGTLTYLSALMAAGIVVGALTAPALAATPAGAAAAEHGGSMGGMLIPERPLNH